MSTTYDWPESFGVNKFEMRIQHNTRAFVSPFSSTSQVLNYTGERWIVSVGMVPGNSVAKGAAIEAFLDRLNGPANRVRMWNLRRPLPLGTIRDGGGNAQWKTATNTNATWQTSAPAAATWSYAGPTLAAAMAIGSNVLPVARTPGTTILAGDHLGAGGQLFRAMDTYTVDATGVALVEVQPRARTTIAAGAAITCTKPTAEFMAKTDGAPVPWRPGMYESTSLDLIEAF
jgi:hypothetical protein